MMRALLCAKCHHPKSRHRSHDCRQTWQTKGRTFTGISTITKWCTCDGYQPPNTNTAALAMMNGGKDSLMLPKKFKKRPVVIEAMQFTGDNAAEVAAWCGGQIVSADCSGYGPPYVVRIDTLEGSMLAERGDYVICGVQGEHYPCREDIFRQTYEVVDHE